MTTSKTRTELDLLWKKMLAVYPDGVSNTSTSKYDKIRQFIADALGIPVTEVYATGAKTRTSNLDTRLVQGNQAGRHTKFGAAFLQSNALRNNSDVDTLSDSAVTTSRKFVDGTDVTRYDAIGVFVEFGGKLLLTRVIESSGGAAHKLLAAIFSEAKHVQVASTASPSSQVPPKVPSSAGGGKNIIFYGPPGTGKSRLAQETADGFGSKTFRTLFHPEFTYADFIGAYRPVVGFDKSSQITDRSGVVIDKPVSYFQFVPGVLAEALRKALAEPQQHVVLLIDEINRGDCAAIFGDFFQLLDRDASGQSKYGIYADAELLRYLSQGKVNVDIMGDGKLYLPSNLSLLATMNTSDQSLYAMDAAFKRRWNWEPCYIEYAELENFIGTRPLLVGDVSKEEFDWINLLQAINKRVASCRMEDKQIGPWFIIPDSRGRVEMREFGNKCLFYLWHDVFKDDQRANESPFREGASQHTFADLQKTLAKAGLKAVLKDELMREVSPKAKVPVPSELKDEESGSLPESE